MPLSTRSVVALNEELRSYASSGGDSTYQAIGDPLANPPRLVKFKNDSDQDVTISYDGITDHDIILAGDREVEDLTTNKTITDGFSRRKGTQIYAKSASGTGNLYIVIIYAED